VPNLINLPAFTEDGDVYVVVETPRGSRAKFDYDPKLGAFTLSKSLLTGLTYPHDSAFLRSSRRAKVKPNATTACSLCQGIRIPSRP
jgi:inorganic pyrophosphatase